MKITKNRMFYFTAVVVVACVIASSVVAMMTTNTSVQAETLEETKQRELTFVIGEKDGRVAAFVKDVEIPYIRTDTPVNSLPYDVQERLRAGIEFGSEQEMKRMLDEICS